MEKTSSLMPSSCTAEPMKDWSNYNHLKREAKDHRNSHGSKVSQSLSCSSSFTEASVLTIKPIPSQVTTGPKASSFVNLSKEATNSVQNTAKARNSSSLQISTGEVPRSQVKETGTSKHHLHQVHTTRPFNSLHQVVESSTHITQNSSNSQRPPIIDLTGDDESAKPSKGNLKRKRTPKEKKKPPYNEGCQISYPYQLLKKDEIRLLAVAGKGPGQRRLNEPLVCRFIHVSLKAPPPFEALSYTWGSPIVRDKEIRICNNNTICWMKITKNLEKALLRLRHDDDRERLMWIDAVCINQEDVAERNAQVMRMAEIYSRAFNVCIWLGAIEKGHFKITRTTALRYTEPKYFDGLIEDKGLGNPGEKLNRRCQHLVSLGELMRRAWFTRRWVLQEIALAQKATVHWDSQSLEWNDFALITALYKKSIDNITYLLNATNILKAQGFPELHAWGANSLVDMKYTIVRKDEGSGTMQRQQTLQSLVVTLSSFEVSEPKDIIYSVLPLAKDAKDALEKGYIVPDYSSNKSTVEVYVDFISYAVKSSRSLDLICTPWAASHNKDGEPLEPLPSWVPVISGKAFEQNQKSGYYNRINADNLTTYRLNPEQPDRPRHNATRGTKVTDDFQILRAPYRMMVRGKRVAVIGQLGEVSKNGNIPMSWLHMAVAAERSKTSLSDTSTEFAGTSSHPYIPEAFWRTLVANQNDEGGPAHTWYHSRCQKFFRQLPATAHGPNTKNGISTRKSIINFSCRGAKQHTSATDAKFLRRIEAATWNRRMFTTAKGTLGIAHADTEQKDSVFFLVGCSVPVVMRKVGGHYKLIAECYLHGAMNGELVEKWGDQWPKSATTLLELR